MIIPPVDTAKYPDSRRPREEDEMCEWCMATSEYLTPVLEMETDDVLLFCDDCLRSTKESQAPATTAIVSLLNEMVAFDPATVAALITARVQCSGWMSAHPTIQVIQDAVCYVGILGVLNGIAGREGLRIVADVEDKAVKTFRAVTEAEFAEMFGGADGIRPSSEQTPG